MFKKAALGSSLGRRRRRHGGINLVVVVPLHGGVWAGSGTKGVVIILVDHGGVCGFSRTGGESCGGWNGNLSHIRARFGKVVAAVVKGNAEAVAPAAAGRHAVTVIGTGAVGGEVLEVTTGGTFTASTDSLVHVSSNTGDGTRHEQEKSSSRKFHKAEHGC